MLRGNKVVLGNPIAKGNTAEIYLTDDKVVKLFKYYLPDTESMNEAKTKNMRIHVGCQFQTYLK